MSINSLKKWEKIIVAVEKGSHEHQICPYCGHNEVNHSFVQIDEKKKMGFGTIWCESCKKGINISRIKVSDKSKEKEIPQDIIFS